jgi:uncharacterized phage-associated protein
VRGGRSGQFAASETNINLTQVVNPPDYLREVLFGRSSRDGHCAICLLETKRALPMLPLDMNFRFNIGKATEVGCLFLERAGGRMNIMKLVKLMYLLDRLSLDRRGVPVAGGDYLSMRNGPVTSELLDLINAGRLFGEPDQRWEQCVTDRRDHDIKLEHVPARDHLSDVEAALLDEIWREHGTKDQWQLVDWCHAHCKEWTSVTNSCAPIAVEQIGMALGKTPQQIQRLRQKAVELNRLDEIFTPA